MNNQKAKEVGGQNLGQLPQFEEGEKVLESSREVICPSLMKMFDNNDGFPDSYIPIRM